MKPHNTKSIVEKAVKRIFIEAVESNFFSKIVVVMNSFLQGL